MLLIPVLITAGADTTVELRNPWQRAWAEFRTSQSPIDYVRVSGQGADPLLVNAAQVDRPGRGWWRNIIDLYGAADILVAQVQFQRLYPGGPAFARFTGYHGPDKQPVGSFTIAAPAGTNALQVMRVGVERMDRMFADALADGRLIRDRSLDIPEPPPPPVEIVEQAPTQQARPWAYQVQIVSPDVNIYNFAMAHLRTTGGVQQVVPVSINPGGVSYVNVTYQGNVAGLRTALAARGWNVEQNGYVLRMSSSGNGPPPIAPPLPQPQPQQPAPAPQATPSQPPRGNE
jgi:hypothetical protein